MRERFEQRIEKGLHAIAQRCEQQRCDPGVIERRIGRLLGQNTRAARLFAVECRRGAVGAPWSHGRASSRRWNRRSVARGVTCCGATCRTGRLRSCGRPTCS